MLVNKWVHLVDSILVDNKVVECTDWEFVPQYFKGRPDLCAQYKWHRQWRPILVIAHNRVTCTSHFCFDLSEVELITFEEQLAIFTPYIIVDTAVYDESEPF